MGHRQRLRKSSMHRLQLAPARWCGCYACWGSPLVWQRTSNRTVSSRREPMPATRTARKYARCIRVHLRGGFRLYSLSKSHSAWLPVRRKHRILEPRHHLFGEGTRRPGGAYDYVQHHRWPLALPLTPHIWPHDRPPHRHRGPLLRSALHPESLQPKTGSLQTVSTRRLEGGRLTMRRPGLLQRSVATPVRLTCRRAGAHARVVQPTGARRHDQGRSTAVCYAERARGLKRARMPLIVL